MKCAANRAITYIVGGLLTLLHWELVWLDPSMFHDFPYDRLGVTLVFAGEIFLTWPAYWIDIYQMGGPWL